MGFDGLQTRHHSLLNRLPLAFILIAFSNSKWSSPRPCRAPAQLRWGAARQPYCFILDKEGTHAEACGDSDDFLFPFSSDDRMS